MKAFEGNNASTRQESTAKLGEYKRFYGRRWKESLGPNKSEALAIDGGRA